MRLGDFWLISAGKKKNPDVEGSPKDSREKTGLTSVEAEERVYPSLGENYARPDLILILRLLVSLLALVLCAVMTLSAVSRLIILLAAALISGYDIVVKAVADISHRMFLRENLFVSLAAALSFCIGRRNEAVIAFLMLQAAYIVRDYALFRTKESICDMLETIPLPSQIPDSENPLAAKEYSVGDEINIESGMLVPADCQVTVGSCMTDLGFVTGNSKPVFAGKGDFIPAGSLCTEGKFSASVCNDTRDSLYMRMAGTLESGYGEKTESERKWQNLTRLFIPFALLISIIMLIVFPLAFKLSIFETLRRVTAVLAVASPCGILFTIPISFFSGMASARKAGIIYRDAPAADKSAKIKSVVFNKVGTLTEKSYSVTEIKTDKMDPDTFLKVAAYAESKSRSAVARAIVSAYGGEISNEFVRDFIEASGKGVSVTVDGIRIILGTGDYISENGVSIPDGVNEGNAAHMSVNGIYAGRIVLSESVAPEAALAVQKLYESGVEHVAMVSGDGREKDRIASTELGIKEYYAECSPAEKIIRIEDMKDRIGAKSTLAFVGACDCPKQLFDASDVGISINAMCCRCSLTNTDVMVMANSVKPLPEVIEAGRRTRRYVFFGVLGCSLIKLLIIVLAVLGTVPLWFALLIDFCASLAVLVNSVGAKPLFRINKPKKT